MENYGEILETLIDPNVEKLYRDICLYFKNPNMTKIKDVEQYSMYMCKTQCLLSKECRYIIAFVPKDDAPEQTTEKLDTLAWCSLQTRTLTDRYPSIASHGYTPQGSGPLKARISRTNVEDSCSIYTCQEYPVEITLLHTSKKSAYDYQKYGTIIAALETYETILTLID